MILTIHDDFDLDKIAESGQCFRWEKQEDAEAYRILHGNSCVYITPLGEGQYNISCEREEFESVWREYFDLDENYARIRARIDPASDPFLSSVCEQEKGIRILRQDPWEMLITFIISQNKNIPAIRRSVEFLAETCGEKKRDSRGLEYFAFPTPDALARLRDDDLKACKLGYRCGYVRKATEDVAAGRLDLPSLLSADEESTLRELTSLYGVGIKVASCISLFGLHHLDAFPKDVWIRRVLSQQYPDGYPFAAYSPYNGVYQQYMFSYIRKAGTVH